MSKKDLSITLVEGNCVPELRDNIDTDKIISADWLKELDFDEAYGGYAYFDERFKEDGTKNIHPFNDCNDGTYNLIVVGDNYGCGSSREHAPQALMWWGIKAFIGESFAPIFESNCLTLGLPTVTAERSVLEDLNKYCATNKNPHVSLDIAALTVTYGATTNPVYLPETTHKALTTGQWETFITLSSNPKEVAKIIGNPNPCGLDKLVKN